MVTTIDWRVGPATRLPDLYSCEQTHSGSTRRYADGSSHPLVRRGQTPQEDDMGDRTIRYIETYWWRLREPITANRPVKSLDCAPDEIAGEIALDYEHIHTYALAEGVTPGLSTANERLLWRDGRGYDLETAIERRLVRSVSDNAPEYAAIDPETLWTEDDWQAIGGGW